MLRYVVRSLPSCWDVKCDMSSTEDCWWRGAEMIRERNKEE